MKNKKSYKSAKPFFQKILKDKEVRIQFEEEKSKTEIAHAVRTTQSVIARLEGGSDKRVPWIPLLARIAAVCGGRFEFGFSFSKAS